jgi:pimeloyl-ACP methyl ester carboxylesterase
VLPYLPAPIQRIALGEMHGGPDRVIDGCLQEIVDGLRSPATLRHVLCVIRCWCAEMVKLEAALRRVKRVPTLLVWGDRDFTVSLSSAVRLNRELRASELIVLPGCGHSVFEETPEESNRIMLEWLGRQSLSTARLRNQPRADSVARRTLGTAARHRLSPGT